MTRFDGPCLFPYNGRIYGIARYQATRARRIAELGGMYSRKRTSLFAVEERELRYLCDLPSAGDTSYAGVVVRGDAAWVSSTSSTTGEYRGRQINSRGAELMVLSREPDGWKIRAIHWSSRNLTRAP